jgi:multicomponent Na+:H+ antiporter subunit D
VFFIGLGLLLPLIQDRAIWKWFLIVPGVAALAAIYYAMPAGAHGHVTYWGVNLTLAKVDRLSLVFAHVFAIQAIIGAIFSYHLKGRGQHVAAAFYVGGAFGCVFAGDYLTLFIFWEMMAFASTFLIWLNHQDNPAAIGAGYRYLLVHAAGGMALLIGLLARYYAVGTLDFGQILPADARWYDYTILVGFAVNAAVVPLHAWLTDAYPEATITGAVFMSAFTTKTAVYVLARAFPGYEILAIMGVVMCLYGVFYATIENNARRILAYHIVSQVGFMVAGIGIGTDMTLNGAAAHAYAHILYKGLLFMSVGTVLYATGTAKLTQLGGLAYRLPLVMICYMVAAVSISGVPFFSGFVSKTMTIAGAAEAHRTWLALGMEVASIGTFLSVGIKLPYFAFWSKPEYAGELKPIPVNMYVAMIISSVLCFAIGVNPGMLYALLPFPVDFQPYTSWHLLQMFQLVGFTGLGFYLMRKIIVPHAKLNLDFDYVYRLIGKAAYWSVSYPLSVIDGFWSEVYARIGLRSMLWGSAATQVFDKGVIDGVLDGTAYTVRDLGGVAARGETGRLQDYLAGLVVLGVGIFALVWYLT